MKRIENYILGIWTDHSFIIFRMSFVWYLVSCFYYNFNHIQFSWIDEIWNTIGYTIIFVIIYAIAVCLDLKRSQSSPFQLANQIEKDISEYVFNQSTLRKESRGLFSTNVRSDENNGIIFVYSPIYNPGEIISKIDAFIHVLDTINTHSSNELKNKLKIYRGEAEYMRGNEVREVYEKIS